MKIYKISVFYMLFIFIVVYSLLYLYFYDTDEQKVGKLKGLFTYEEEFIFNENAEFPDYNESNSVSDLMHMHSLFMLNPDNRVSLEIDSLEDFNNYVEMADYQYDSTIVGAYVSSCLLKESVFSIDGNDADYWQMRFIELRKEGTYNGIMIRDFWFDYFIINNMLVIKIVLFVLLIIGFICGTYYLIKYYKVGYKKFKDYGNEY